MSKVAKLRLVERQITPGEPYPGKIAVGTIEAYTPSAFDFIMSHEFIKKHVRERPMRLQLAVSAGWRIRHRDWPPYHYAELRSAPDGKLKLYQVAPNGEAKPLDMKVEDLREEDGWLIVDDRPE